MFFRKSLKTLEEGVLDDVRMGRGLTAKGLRVLAETGRVRVLVPVDPKISPWAAPKLFELSTKQAVELMDAFEKAPEMHGLVQYYVRADDSVVLLRRENADTGINCVPAGRAPAMQGAQNQYR